MKHLGSFSVCLFAMTSFSMPNNELKKEVDISIECCKNVEDLYQLGVKYRKKSSIEEEISKKDFLEAAYECFSMVRKKLTNIGFQWLKESSKDTLRKAIYNMGWIENEGGKKEEAAKNFFISFKMGLKVAEISLLKIKKIEKNSDHFIPSLASDLAYNALEKVFNKLIQIERSKMLCINQPYFTKEMLNLSIEEEKIKLDNLIQEIHSKIERFDVYTPLVAESILYLVDKNLYSIDKLLRNVSFLHTEKGYSKSKLEKAKFTESQLREIQRVVYEIKKQVNFNDLIISIGRSPLYFTRMLQAFFPQIKIIEMPFTLGIFYIEDFKNEYKANRHSRDSYKEFIKYKLTDYLNKNNLDQIILLDHIDKGTSLSYFYELISEINIFASKICCLGLVSSENKKTFNDFNIIQLNKEIVEIIQKKHGPDQAYSFGVPFYPDQWDDWQEINFNPPLLLPAHIRLTQILEWVEQHK